MYFIGTNRRAFLRATGICLALPGLESIRRASGEDSRNDQSRSVDSSSPQCMVCIGNEFGMYPGAFWPDTDGADYELPTLLEPLAEHREQMTVFGHLDHGLKGGHFAVHTFLTGIKSADAVGAPEGGISLDQRAAEFVGSRTRFPSITVGSEDGLHGGPMMSWTRTGTRIPPVPGPRELYRQLFIDDDQASRQKADERIELQESILDSVLGDARSLKRRVSKVDKEKLEEYFSAVRDVEVKLSLDRKWQHVAKPSPGRDEPKNEGLTKDLPKIYDLLALALQTDSTRVATLEIGGGFAASDLGIKKGYHGLSHHGKVQANIDLLVEIERYQVEQFSRFLAQLKSITDAHTGQPLLDRTMVLFGSGMGNANSHTNSDLPIILAGSDFSHGQYRIYPEKGTARIPLSNLYLSMLRRFGVEAERFSASTGTLRGFEVV